MPPTVRQSSQPGGPWDLTSDPTQLITVTHLSQDPREGYTTTWYAVTGEFNGSSNADRGIRAPRYGEGLYMSTDNGDSWTLIESSRNPTLLDSPFDIGLKVLASPTTGSIFTASQAFGIQRLQIPSSDREWLLGNESLPRWSDFDIASNGSIIAVTSIGVTPSPTDLPGVFYSTDNGDTWQTITPPGFPDAPDRSVIAFAPSDPGLAYLWTFTGETVPSTTSSFGQDEVMVVDIGGGTTEIAVIALSGIVIDESIRVAGDELDNTILTYFKRNHNLLIGLRTAERIKCEIGSAVDLEPELEISVKGRDLVSGIPKIRSISSEDVREALNEPIGQIAAAVLHCLERTPPELGSDILERGIMLTGGGALLKGLDTLIRNRAEIPVYIAEDPLTAVVRGTGKVLENIETYEKVLT